MTTAIRVQRPLLWLRTSCFAPMPRVPYLLFRTMVGLVGLVWFGTLFPDLTAFFGANGLNPNPEYEPARLGLFRWLVSDVWLYVAAACGVAASGFTVAGRGLRLAAPVLAVMVMSFMADNWIIWNSGDQLFRTVSVLFGCYCLLTPSQGLNGGFRSAFKPGVGVKAEPGPIWLFRLLQIQLTLIYLVTFFEKVAGESWRSGTATLTVFRMETLDRFPVPDFLLTNIGVANLMTWSVLAVEGLLPVLLWNSRTRRMMIIVGVLFHLAIDWTLNIGVFSWIVIAVYFTFLRPEDFGGRLVEKIAASCRWPGPVRLLLGQSPPQSTIRGVVNQ